MKQVGWILLLIKLPLSATMVGQAVSPFKVWLEKEEFEEITIIRGFCENTTNELERLRYEFKTIIGDQEEINGNIFLVAPKSIQKLNRAVTFFTVGNFDKISLKIYRQNELIASDSISTLEEVAQLAVTQKPQPQKTNDQASTFSGLEIDGLIIDETRSKVAHTFYEYFYSKWYAPSGITGFLIKIKETPAPGVASRIAIELNGEKLIERPLEPRDEKIEIAASQSVIALQRHLEQQQSVQQEIGNSDVQGSGIY